MVQVPPQYSVAEVAQIFKGGASWVPRKEYPELEEFLWGDSFWAEGYFAETAGNVYGLIRRLKNKLDKLYSIIYFIYNMLNRYKFITVFYGNRGNDSFKFELLCKGGEENELEKKGGVLEKALTLESFKFSIS